MQRILILGGGFAGLWSAVGAARRLDELGIPAEDVEILLVDRRPYHSIRVRNYEVDLSQTCVPFSAVLDPIGVRHLEGDVADIDVAGRSVAVTVDGKKTHLTYDRLVFALGSHVARPSIPGLDQFGFDVDTYASAMRVNDHIAALPKRPPSAARDSVLVVGAGLTGIETVAELPGKLRAAFGGASEGLTPRVILADHKPWIGSDMGDSARPVITEALAALGVDCRPGVSVAAIDAEGVVLDTGERIDAATVVWCAGMRADALTARFPVKRDRLDRIPVDPTLKISGLAAEFAAGDVAFFLVDGTHPCVMSCQHGRPMGRFAGYNVVNDLLGMPMMPLRIDWYSTILDLGPWGAVYTEGWDRQVVTQGAAAKQTKEIINRQRIYPPLTGNRREILDAAAPVVQAPPQRFR